MSTVKVNERTLSIGQRELSFDHRISETLEQNGLVVVRFKVHDFEVGDPLVGRNIMAFDQAGNELWRVADHGIRVPNDPDTPEAFFGIDPIEGSDMILATTARWLLDLDPETGEVSNPRYRYPGM